MDISDYVEHDAVGLAELISSGQVSAAEVEHAARRAIAVVEPHLNAVAGEPFPAALEHNRSGPLAGVPFGIKDSSPAVKGVLADYACRALAGHVPTSEGNVMRRFRRAGLAGIVRTTGPELHMYCVTESDVYGITRNPWNLGMTPGGSSGGSGALVGSRALPIASAGDAGGSTRMPAGFTGTVGLLPTTGRVSYSPAGERLYGLSRPFVLVRSMRDTALVLDELAGPEPGDRNQVPPPARPWVEELNAESAPLRVGLSTTSPLAPHIDAAAVAGAERVAAQLESMGHTVVPADPPLDPEFMIDTLVNAWACGLAQAVASAMRAGGAAPTEDQFEPNTWLHIAHGLRQGPAAGLDAYEHINLLTRPMAEFFETIDVLVSPTNPRLAMPVGEWNGHRHYDDLRHLYVEAEANFEAFMSIWNVTGQPALALPLGHDDESGMPVSTQLVGRWGDESTLIRLGADLERAMPWRDRIAPIDAAMGQ